MNPFLQAFGPIDGNCTQSAIGRAIVNDWLFKQQQEFDEGRPLGRLHTAYIPIRSFGTFDSQNSPRRNNDDAFHKSPCLVYFTPVGLHESSSYVTFGKRDRTIAGENVVYHARDKERFSSNIYSMERSLGCPIIEQHGDLLLSLSLYTQSKTILPYIAALISVIWKRLPLVL